jgi:integrase
MASLIDHSERYWVVRFKDSQKKPKVKDLYFGKDIGRSTASKIRDDLARQYVEGVYDPWNPHPETLTTLGDFIDSYVTEKSRTSWSKGTAKIYSYVLSRVKDELGRTQIEQSRDKLEAWVNSSDFRPETRKTYKGMVNALLKWSEVHSPNLGRVRVWGTFQQEHHYVTHEQMVYLTSKIGEGDWLKDFIPFLFYTGMRIGEAMSLKTSNIRDGWIVIGAGFTTKTRKQRFIPINAVPGLPQIVDRWMAKERIDDTLFMHKDPKRASRRIKALIRKHLGVEDLKAHSFRHGCAVWLLTKGVDVYDVSKWLGHTRLSTTEKYVDLAPVDLARRVKEKITPQVLTDKNDGNNLLRG